MRFGKTTPILRIFDEAKTKELYVDFLGFKIDWKLNDSPWGSADILVADPFCNPLAFTTAVMHLTYSQEYGCSASGSGA